MAGGLNHSVPGGMVCGEDPAQNDLTITRGSAHTLAAHTADNTVQYSRTCHAARHDVNDPSLRALGPPFARTTGVAHIMACCSIPHANCFGKRHRAPLAAASARG